MTRGNGWTGTILRVNLTEGTIKKEPLNMQDAQDFVGARIGYAYNSFFGPLAFNLFWSNHTGKVGAFLSIGHAF